MIILGNSHHMMGIICKMQMQYFDHPFLLHNDFLLSNSRPFFFDQPISAYIFTTLAGNLLSVKKSHYIRSATEYITIYFCSVTICSIQIK